MRTWEQEAVLHDPTDRPDAVVIRTADVRGDPSMGQMDCVLYYDPDGDLGGILNHFPTVVRKHPAGGVLHPAGDLLMVVRDDLDYYEIGMKLIRKAVNTWTDIDPDSVIETYPPTCMEMYDRWKTRYPDWHPGELLDTDPGKFFGQGALTVIASIPTYDFSGHGVLTATTTHQRGP